MTKERKTQAVTVLVLLAALGVVLGKKYEWRFPRPNIGIARSAPKPDPTPQDAVYGMLDAARLGDVKAYLGCYTGQMAAGLKQSLTETGEAGMAKYLRESNAAIKGVAIAEPQAITDREVKVRVEYVYQDRNEAQWMYLEKAPGGWKIARVDGAERAKTLVPYGTPVQ